MKALAILILVGCACASVARVHSDAAKMGMSWMVERQVPTPYSMRCFWNAWRFAAFAIALAILAGWLAGRA